MKPKTGVNGTKVEFYDDDEEIDRSWKELQKFRDNLPYNYKRYTMIIGFTILVMIVVWLGYAYGGLKVCSQLDGVLDSDFICHPNYAPPINNVNNVGMPFTIPNIIVDEPE